jgi:hypothetical protein
MGRELLNLLLFCEFGRLSLFSLCTPVNSLLFRSDETNSLSLLLRGRVEARDYTMASGTAQPDVEVITMQLLNDLYALFLPITLLGYLTHPSILCPLASVKQTLSMVRL